MGEAGSPEAAEQQRGGASSGAVRVRRVAARVVSGSRKSMEELILFSERDLGKKAESKHDVQDVAVECSVSKGRCLAPQSKLSSCSSQEGMVRSKAQISPEELIETIFTVPRRLEEEPKVRRCELGTNQSRVPFQKPVLKPLDDVSSYSTGSPNKVIIGRKEAMENNGCSSREGKCLPAYMSWFDGIPPPSDMILPKLKWQGTCIGHAYAECLTSRRRIMAERNGDPIDQVPDVSIPWLIQELTRLGALTKFGGKTLDISKYIREYGAPLVGRTERAYITRCLIAGLTNLQDIMVFDLPDELNSAEFFKVLDERVSLLFEIEENGPVVGLFNAGPHWPDANGKIYYDDCGHEFSRSKGDEGISFGPHAALIYGFDNSVNDLFDIELLLLDNIGPTAHSEGRARMNISSLRGYIAPYVCDNQIEGCPPIGAAVSGSNLVLTNRGENERVMYAVSYMQGWCENVEDYHSAIPDLDESTSFFGIYDGHGGPTVAWFCAENFHSKILHHPDYNSNLENAMKKTFIRIDGTLVDKWRESTNCYGDVCPSMKALACEGSKSDFSTACAVLIRGHRIIIGNAGDSCAVLSRNGQAFDLNIRYKIDYVSKRHASIFRDECGGPRVLGNLDISKVIGFAPYKVYTDSRRKQHVVTCEPDIHTEAITDDTDFLVIASDGIWNHMGSQSVVDFIRRHLEQTPQEETNLGAVCERLVAYCNPGGDNMTVMLILFKRPAITTAAAPKNDPDMNFKTLITLIE